MSRRAFLIFLLVLLFTLPEPPVGAEPAVAAGSISGRVTDVLTGAPLADATVDIPNTSLKTQTDTDGRYRLANVPSGPRHVFFRHSRYASQYYGAAPMMFLATPVEVKPGEETAGIDAALAPGARITGCVTDKDTGAPLAGIRVVAKLPDYRPPWRIVQETLTGVDGRYALEGLWTDVYLIEFVDEAGDHATQAYEANVGVLTGEEVVGIDMALGHEGHIAGQVTDLATGEPLAGVTVSVLGPEDDGYAAATVETDASGLYEAASLPAGAYWLHFGPHDKLHAARYYGGTEDVWQSQSVQVEVGRTTGGIDQPLPEISAITGRVTDALTGEGLRGLGVYLDWYSEYRAPDVTTRPDGTYIIPSVAPGKHTVWVHDPDRVYRDGPATALDEGETVTVEAGRVSREVNAALTPWAVSLRKITGSVTDVVTGEPLGGIRVALYDCYHSYHVECWDVLVTSTDAAGKYTFGDPPGAEGISFSDPNGVYLYQEASNVRVPDPDEAMVIDAALRKPEPEVYGAITGTVTAAATSEALAGQRVCAYFVDAALAEWLVAWVDTAADGAYRIDGLSPGQYKVMVGCHNRMGARYVTQWHDGKVTVSANGIAPGIDFALAENGRITGTVTDSLTGAPIAGAGLAICNADDCSYATTGSDGVYVAWELPGAYRVQARADGHESRYYPDTVARDQAEMVTVTLGAATSGIDVALPRLGGIAGQVTDAGTGVALAGITVKIITKDGGWYTNTTGSDGRYARSDLSRGAYRVRFEDAQGSYAAFETGPVTVTVNTMATVDAALIPNGYITGKVVAAESGEPLGGIEVRANYPWATTTAPDGTYKIGPLPDGEYRVRFWDGGLLRRMEYYRETTQYNGYTPVIVRHGETTSGIDESMDLLAWARGRVVDADTGAPIAGVKVWGSGEWPTYNPVVTDAEGHYEVKGLNDGTYALSVRDSTHVYVDGSSEKLTFQAGQIVDAPDIKLKRWGEFGGTVTDARTGAPVAGVWVLLYDITSWGEWYVIGGCYAITGADGAYRIRGMYNWTVRPAFSDPQARYRAQSYGGGASLLDAQEVTFQRGSDTLGIDAALVRRGGEGPDAVAPRVAAVGGTAVSCHSRKKPWFRAASGGVGRNPVSLL